MRNLSAPVVALLALTDQSRLRVAIEVLTDTPIRVVASETSMTLNGATYTPDGIGISRLVQDLRRPRQAFVLSIQNVADTAGAAVPWSSFVQTNELNGSEVKIRVWAIATSADPFVELFNETRWFVSGWGITGTALEMRCGPPQDAYAIKVPIDSIIEQTCNRDYGTGFCTNHEEDNGFATCPGHTSDECFARTPAGGVMPFGPGLPFISKGSRRRRGS